MPDQSLPTNAQLLKDGHWYEFIGLSDPRRYIGLWRESAGRFEFAASFDELAFIDLSDVDEVLHPVGGRFIQGLQY